MLSPQEHRRLEQYIHDIDVDHLSRTFDALGEPNRCLMFRALLKGNPVQVGDLARVIGISDALASQHLKILRNAGLITKQRDGKRVLYRVDDTNHLVGALRKAVET